MRRSWLIAVLAFVVAPAGTLAGPAQAAPLAGPAQAAPPAVRLAGPAQAAPGTGHRGRSRTHDAAPPVVLSSPAAGALFLGGQPSFSGTAGTAPDDDVDVTVDVYVGGSASGVLAQILTAPVSSTGAYAIGPAAPLADGVYSAQASQGYSSGSGESPVVSFRVDNAGPGIELDPPASEPFVTQTPTLSGYASTATGDASAISLLAYPGSSTNAGPTSVSSGMIAADGSFSVTVSPVLKDGIYTLVATQDVSGGIVFSAPRTVEVNATPPALTVAVPAAGANLAQNALRFSGVAGAGYGDSSSVEVSIYHGGTATGRRVGIATAQRHGLDWRLTWPKQLRLGIYTLRARQRDLAGDVTSVTSTFLVIPARTAKVGR